MTIRKSRMIILTSFIIIAIVIYIFVYPVLKYSLHITNLKNSLSENEQIKTELLINKDDYFCIPVQYNDEHTVNLIIDTKATSLIREDSIESYGGSYWGKLPFGMKDAYNQKMNIDLYIFDYLIIGHKKIKSPLVTKATKNSSVYPLLEDGLLGTDILSIGTWKFDLEKNSVLIFHSDNQELLQKETDGYIKIENGLVDNNIELIVDSHFSSEKFTLDLGFGGDIQINNSVRNSLIEHNYPYQKITRIEKDLQRTDTIYIFDNIPIKIDTLEIKNCQLVNINTVNENFIGAVFMKHFNFILMYGHYVNHKPQKHLFIKMIEKDSQIQPHISKFGLNISKYKDKVFIKSIMEDGIAEKKNLTLGEEILEITNFDLSSENLTDTFMSYTENIDSVHIKTKKKEVILNIRD